ncbi:MAG: hypothetical protein EPO07_07445 [Verrucomicrobia bacterium]|nr:MAG: hypothetical protein EPO07_07445 [Verrucomicrobiota bacterium]
MNPLRAGAAFGALVCLMCAGEVLAATTLTSVAISSPSPNSVIQGGSATYTVTVSRTGNGNLEIYLTVAGLPPGATAAFSPSMIRFSSSTPTSATATLTITTSAATPACTYSLPVTASDGGSPNKKSCTATLMVAGSPDAPGVLCAGKLPDGSFRITCEGAPNQSCIVQATENLGSPNWVTLGTNTTDANGVFAFIDFGATNCPCRFYRSLPAD